MTIKVGSTDSARAYAGSSRVNKVYVGTVQSFGPSTTAPAASVAVKNYSVTLGASGGGTVEFSMSPDGTTSPDTQGWYTVPTVGVGTGKWVIFSQTGGTLSCSGAAIGSRVQLSSAVTVSGTFSGTATRSATFNVQIYDAASGGTLLGSGTLYLEVDGLG